MLRSNWFGRILGACGWIVLAGHMACASVSTADSVVQYNTGADPLTFYGEPYDQASAALGLPDASINLAENDTLGIYPDDSIVTPFSAEYNPANIVGISGDGGDLELHMLQPISTAGYTLGVHTGSGLNDSAYPDGINYDPASTYTDTRSATVLVSSDGANWVSLGSIDFDNPTNIYTDIGSAYTDQPGSDLANFGQPFLGSLDSFDGKDFSGTLSVLDGSAGGTWLDLSGTGLSQINYIKFETDSEQTMYVDAVVGIPVPEPASAALLGLSALLWRRR
jgi:hypothetical protein